MNTITIKIGLLAKYRFALKNENEVQEYQGYEIQGFGESFKIEQNQLTYFKGDANFGVKCKYQNGQKHAHMGKFKNEKLVTGSMHYPDDKSFLDLTPKFFYKHSDFVDVEVTDIT